MRVNPGEGMDSILSRMTREQRDAIERVVEAKDGVEQASKDSKTAIREAILAGVPASVISQKIGVSTKRVYQIRDEAAA